MNLDRVRTLESAIAAASRDELPELERLRVRDAPGRVRPDVQDLEPPRFGQPTDGRVRRETRERSRIHLVRPRRQHQSGCASIAVFVVRRHAPVPSGRMT